MTQQPRTRSWSPLLLNTLQLILAVGMVVTALAVPNSNAQLRRGILLSAAVLLIVAALAQVVIERARRHRRAAMMSNTSLPSWVGGLPRPQYDELDRLVRELGRRARVADQTAAQSRRRASQSLHGMWQVMSSAVSSEERVRGRFVADLHDSVVQSIIVATYLAEDEDTPREDLVGHLREAERQLRDIMVLTRPPDLTRGNLGTAVSSMTRSMQTRAGISVTWSWPEPELEVAEATAQTLYRFFQESLNNVAKHAGVDRATAGLSIGDNIVAWVSDKGRGFDPGARAGSASGHHVGLELMSERAQQLGADIEVSSAPGEGTRVTLTLPLPPAGLDRPVQVGTVVTAQPG